MVIQKKLRVLIPMCGRLRQPVGGLLFVLYDLSASEIQFAESILCVLRSILCDFRQPFHHLPDFLRRSGGVAQDQLRQLVLGVLISALCGLLEPTPGGGFIF